MPITGQQIQEFGSVNIVTAEDKLAQNHVAFATNVDFSHTGGAAGVRQGSVRVVNIGASEINNIYRYYNKASHGDSPWYVASAGSIYRVTGGFGAPSATAIATGGSSDANDMQAMSAYGDYVHIASGGVHIKDNGTSTQPWIKPNPTSAVTSTAVQTTPLTVVATWTVNEAESAQVGNTYTSTATADANPSTLRVEFAQVPATTNLNTNSSVAINQYGVHHVDLKFSEPKFVSRVSIDYSIGDTNFDNYVHAEFDVVLNSDATPETEVLLEEEVELGAGEHVSLDDVAQAKARARRRLRPAKTRVSFSKNTFNTVSLSATLLEFIGKNPGSGMADIQSCRLIVETWGPCTVEARNWVIQGDENHTLHAPNQGYTYYETWAIADSDEFILSESPPSPASTPTKFVQAQGLITSGNSAPSWATHRLLYRKGGRLADAYAVATNVAGTATYTDTMSDIKALIKNSRMKSNLRNSLPQGIRAISEPYKERLFVGYDNQLIWTLPGNPDSFPNFSETTVSHDNDRIQAIYSWGDILTIINRDTIYELRGSIFEGQQQDWVLRKSGATGGSYAPRATIKTPYGILLVRSDGLFIYTPGQGIERRIDWAMELLGDIFKGQGSSDPAQEKGSRAGGGLNQTYIQHCVAAYHNEMIYFGWPSGSDQRPSLIAKLDMKTQRASIYSYPWDVSMLFGDRDSNALVAGSTSGELFRLDQGLVDQDASASSTPITWSIGSRRWTVPTDTGFENLNIEYEGDPVEIRAEYDGTATTTIDTLPAGGTRDWHNPPFNGTFAQQLQLKLYGTQTGTQSVIYNLTWDALAHPYRRHFWRTDHWDNNYDGEKIFDVFYSDIEVIGTGNVTGVVYVDNTAVMTQTVAGPTNGRVIEQKAFPIDTFGEIAYCIYTATDTTVEFKLWETSYNARNEPPRITSFKTDYESLEENLVEAVDVDINPGGTTTQIAYIDNTAIQTNVITGTARQSYTFEIPINNYGRTVHAEYTGGPFKHYKTWWHLRREPDRWKNYQWGPEEFGEERWIKTWMCVLNPLGNTVYGTVYADGTAITTGTFTGTNHESFVNALDLDGSNNIREASRVEIDYSSTGVFKHYRTEIESAPKPFDKTQWTITYRKIGGASELELAESFNLDIEVPTGTATLTSIWDVDGNVLATNTYTFAGREWRDDIAPPPGMRGRLFRQRIFSSQNFRVWSSGLDLVQTGRKGVSLRTIKGTPS